MNKNREEFASQQMKADRRNKRHLGEIKGTISRKWCVFEEVALMVLRLK